MRQGELAALHILFPELSRLQGKQPLPIDSAGGMIPAT